MSSPQRTAPRGVVAAGRIRGADCPEFASLARCCRPSKSSRIHRMSKVGSDVSRSAGRARAMRPPGSLAAGPMCSNRWLTPAGAPMLEPRVGAHRTLRARGPRPPAAQGPRPVGVPAPARLHVDSTSKQTTLRVRASESGRPKIALVPLGQSRHRHTSRLNSKGRLYTRTPTNDSLDVASGHLGWGERHKRSTQEHRGGRDADARGIETVCIATSSFESSWNTRAPRCTTRPEPSSMSDS